MTSDAPVEIQSPVRPSLWTSMCKHEDWWAIWIGGLALLLIVGSVMWNTVPEGKPPVSALKDYLAKPGKWSQSPLDAFKAKDGSSLWKGILGVGVLSGLLFAIGQAGMGKSPVRFLQGFVVIFLMALLTYLLSEQEIIKYYNLEYPLWGLLVGLLVNLTVGVPAFLQPALLTEFYIKTGLVLLGVEVLLPNLIALGVPGIGVSWVVTQ